MKPTLLLAALLVALVVAAPPAQALRAGPFVPLDPLHGAGRRLMQQLRPGPGTLSMLAATNTKGGIEAAVDSDSPAHATDDVARSAVGDTMLATVGGPYALYGLTAPRP
jgi:hypothetical protein